MLDRFLAFVKEHALFQRNHRILAAVSGGVDSVVLAELLNQASIPFGIAHCNFGLRGSESEGDAIFVESLAERYEVPHYRKFFETRTYAEEHGISIQMAARELRLNWLDELCEQEDFTAIALGTHRDDDMETLLLNLVRGTGLRGMTGIQPQRDKLVRPLLFATKEEIHTFAQEESLSWREDSSNASDAYQRNQLRNNVLPVLREINPNLPEAFSRATANFRDVQEFVEQEMETIRTRVLKRSPKGKRITIDLEPLNEHRALGFILFKLLHPFGFNRDQVRGITTALQGFPGKTFSSPTHTLHLDRQRLILSEHASQEHAVASWEEDADHLEEPVSLQFEVVQQAGFEVIPHPEVACLDYGKLRFPLHIRPWRQGDTFQPLGMRQYKKISDFLIDAKVPVPEKAQTYVVESGGQIVWLVNHRIDDRFKLDKQTEKVYLIRSLKHREPK